MNNPFFQGGRYFRQNGLMQVGDLVCEVNMPQALRSRGCGADELAHGLPPYNKRAAFLVDACPNAPEDWVRSSGKTASYVVPVKAEHGLWLDFNRNANNRYDVAVLISIQGVNALTGQKADKLRLEQYRERCPLHRVPFVANRRCSTCGYDWPAQNSICTTGAPRGYLWLDGFRASDGQTRQFVFTEDEARSVAKAVLGDERVHAIGVAFFLSKQPKPVQPNPIYRRSSGSPYLTHSASSLLGGASMRGLSVGASQDAFAKRLEVAAGAKIQQRVHPDPKEPDYWRDEPEGIIVINYVSEQVMEAVLAGGLNEQSEGFLGGLNIPLGQQ